MDSLIFVDCEAQGRTPSTGYLTEFGAVHYKSRQSFHGKIYDCKPDPANPSMSKIVGPKIHEPSDVFRDFEKWIKHVTKGGRAVFFSDNCAYDFMWIADGFWLHLGRNPFGHSGRRISDFYAGLTKDFHNTQEWKKWRITPHDHNPVHDCLGNVEAFGLKSR